MGRVSKGDTQHHSTRLLTQATKPGDYCHQCQFQPAASAITRGLTNQTHPSPIVAMGVIKAVDKKAAGAGKVTKSAQKAQMNITPNIFNLSLNQVTSKWLVVFLWRAKVAQLRITQCLRLDQPKLDEVTSCIKVAGPNDYAILLAIPESSESQSSSSSDTDTSTQRLFPGFPAKALAKPEEDYLVMIIVHAKLVEQMMWNSKL
ncbi:hypothetical protein P7K49_005179 [Saguinus oedipus]|uniref:SPOC domain-containing protein n=1 Tax=Saguinus oedipus TaxID=9490 RepID=A0ABQ9W9I0_SAGOE|nr:hypothetical protein P7K49_005179 [Saguinus oedipus]